MVAEDHRKVAGEPRSKGYGFAELTTHEHALAGTLLIAGDGLPNIQVC